MVRSVIRYNLSPFRDWLNRDYGLITRARGKSAGRLLRGGAVITGLSVPGLLPTPQGEESGLMLLVPAGGVFYL